MIYDKKKFFILKITCENLGAFDFVETVKNIIFFNIPKHKNMRLYFLAFSD